MKTLDQLGLEHGTDKASSFHSYLDTYERYLSPLRDKPVRLLEIGVLGGASLKMWRDYFLLGRIFGLDCDDKTGLKLGERIEIIRGDSSKQSGWLAVYDEMATAFGQAPFFDAIVDDGAHTVFSVIKAFQLGFPMLNPGGLYIVEDVHSGYIAQYRRDNGNLPAPESATTAEFFTSLIDEGVNENGLNECGKIASPQTRIKFIHFWKSLIIVGKV
jgi:demethylmacrocin O-methyltransferase